MYRSRRFQIHSGFIFERTVAAELERQGLYLTGIKRLKRKEFNVVTVRDGVIFNVQCKNNLIDPSGREGNPKLSARFNRARVASFERALREEVGREALLITELGLTQIAHLVVTRFPVATDNPKIISFSRIEAFSSVANKLAAEMT